MHMVYLYFRNQFKASKNGLRQLILIHIFSFLLLFLFETGCYICGCKDYFLWLYRQLTFPSLYPLLLQRPWTIITYSFIHKGFIDLFWDIFILYIFAQKIPAITRSKHILRLYGLGQIVGAIVFGMLYHFSPPFKGMATDLTGPSAAIYAIMVAVCVSMPNLRLYCFFFSLPLRYIALALLLIALIHLPTQYAGAYLAQLGGALVGYVYGKLCKNDMQNQSFFSTNAHGIHRTYMSVKVTKQ
ncbi:rhomboid family intramembrane serine protease [Cardinium endosymbiont of Bemisia tabaci]|uniref:rhomboid family intramembrane serine protease n=1 Tax=Candidatus Cardinium TaxID=273135 RepID=UPI000442D0C0|nr:rhomboid family intramembrane serine protease [Cardinium endosymbiont of Bemisia tabaci]CDG49590.1 Rhomboid family protein [Cardinium endosymbiont cBtQ1 of Bemisia tabaci]